MGPILVSLGPNLLPLAPPSNFSCVPFPVANPPPALPVPERHVMESRGKCDPAETRPSASWTFVSRSLPSWVPLRGRPWFLKPLVPPLVHICVFALRGCYDKAAVNTFVEVLVVMTHFFFFNPKVNRSPVSALRSFRKSLFQGMNVGTK